MFHHKLSRLGIGEYYRRARNIPVINIVHVIIPNRPRKLNALQFQVIKQEIDAHPGLEFQSVVMVWTAPYAVECISITSAYTLVFNAEQCEKTCGAGKASPYFNPGLTLPFADYGVRLSTLLPTESVWSAKSLIDRDVASGFRICAASACYFQTSDTARSSWSMFFPPSGRILQKRLTIGT